MKWLARAHISMYLHCKFGIIYSEFWINSVKCLHHKILVDFFHSSISRYVKKYFFHSNGVSTRSGIFFFFFVHDLSIWRKPCQYMWHCGACNKTSNHFVILSSSIWWSIYSFILRITNCNLSTDTAGEFHCQKPILLQLQFHSYANHD